MKLILLQDFRYHDTKLEDIYFLQSSVSGEDNCMK